MGKGGFLINYCLTCSSSVSAYASQGRSFVQNGQGGGQLHGSRNPLGTKRSLQWDLAAAAKSLQSCPTLRPQRRQPTRLPCPWDSPGTNTGVGCHFLLQCMKVKSESEVVQLCLTLSMDCSLPGSSVHGIFQARVLEWGAIAFS